jgi:hypothetical protein
MSQKVIVFFDVPQMSVAQYDQVMRDLDAAGQDRPNGRLSHTAAANGDGWRAVDVWDSEEALNAFAGTLMPVLVQNGVTPPQPQVLPVYNIV